MKNYCPADITGKCMNCEDCAYLTEHSKKQFKTLWDITEKNSKESCKDSVKKNITINKIKI